MTAFYSVRILTKGFNQEVELDKKTFEKAHEPGQPMTITLIILGVASIYIGYVMKDLMIGPGVENVELIAKEGQHGIESEFIEG
jgi:NADH:ubiquinone oxidoreductase subunit 5 (subunit L)/multisubunit Na+/H+ antiporter MnhA subunit